LVFILEIYNFIKDRGTLLRSGMRALARKVVSGDSTLQRMGYRFYASSMIPFSAWLRIWCFSRGYAEKTRHGGIRDR
jgi:hypothetical protein